MMYGQEFFPGGWSRVRGGCLISGGQTMLRRFLNPRIAGFVNRRISAIDIHSASYKGGRSHAFGVRPAATASAIRFWDNLRELGEHINEVRIHMRGQEFFPDRCWQERIPASATVKVNYC